MVVAVRVKKKPEGMQSYSRGSVVNIHFICTGNIYRSRLAEAYCASRCVPGIRVFSSGIAAGLNGVAPISTYAADLLTQHGISSYAATGWQRTTPALVRASDVLVFMESEHHRFCEDWIDAARQGFEVWEIEDVGPIDESEIPKKAERTFEIIRQRTDSLLTALGQTNGIQRS
jgi:protein-tyrosine-phosphatase